MDTHLSSNEKQKGLSRTEICIGDVVGFLDSDNVEQYGKVIRLNQKTVTLEGRNMGWRVPYSYLFKVHEQAFEALVAE